MLQEQVKEKKFHFGQVRQLAPKITTLWETETGGLLESMCRIY